MKICTDFESGQKENKVRNVHFIAIGGCAFYCNREAVQLANMDPDKIIKTHMEFVAPAIQRKQGPRPKLIRAELFPFYLGKISFEYVSQDFTQGLGHIVMLDKAAIKTAKSFALNCKCFVQTPTCEIIKS